MGLLRKLRGLLSFGAMWGFTWGVIGAGIGAIIGVVNPGLGLSTPVVEWAIGMGLYGLVSGVGFAGLLSLREGRKRLRELSLWRVAIWGVLGAAAVPPIFGLLGTFPAGTTLIDVLGAIGVTAALGGTFATTSVAMARRAEIAAGDDPALLGWADDR